MPLLVLSHEPTKGVGSSNSLRLEANDIASSPVGQRRTWRTGGGGLAGGSRVTTRDGDDTKKDDMRGSWHGRKNFRRKKCSGAMRGNVAVAREGVGACGGMTSGTHRTRHGPHHQRWYSPQDQGVRRTALVGVHRKTKKRCDLLDIV